jgi:hypothetical protein
LIHKYIKFLSKSSNQHGVHSPFVYHLITKCFYQKTNVNLWNLFLKEKQLLSSKSNESSSEKISTKKVKLLIRLVAYFKPKTILEVGNSNFITSTAFKIGNKNTSIFQLKNGLEMISKDIKNKQFDFIYFNENTTKTATLNYFNTCLSTLNNDATWVFNNMYNSKELQECWLEIKNNPKVTVTVDLFFWGIVFFRKEQAKEHFKIRV